MHPKRKRVSRADVGDIDRYGFIAERGRLVAGRCIKSVRCIYLKGKNNRVGFQPRGTDRKDARSEKENEEEDIKVFGAKLHA